MPATRISFAFDKSLSTAALAYFTVRRNIPQIVFSKNSCYNSFRAKRSRLPIKKFEKRLRSSLAQYGKNAFPGFHPNEAPRKAAPQALWGKEGQSPPRRGSMWQKCFFRKCCGITALLHADFSHGKENFAWCL